MPVELHFSVLLEWQIEQDGPKPSFDAEVVSRVDHQLLLNICKDCDSLNLRELHRFIITTEGMLKL